MRLKNVIQLDDAATTCRVVKVYRDAETNEYVCKLFISGGHYEPADYFTNDYDDAIGTAKAMCKTYAQSILALFNFLRMTTTERLERLYVESLPVESGDIMHWKFSDSSMIYYNKRNDSFTV